MGKTLKTIKRQDIIRPDMPGRPHDQESHFQRLFEQVSREMEKRYNPVRSWPLYFYQRQLSQVLDRLPASFTIGLDFEFLLRKE